MSNSDASIAQSYKIFCITGEGLSAIGVAFLYGIEFSGEGVDDVSPDGDVGWHEGMTPHQVYGLAYGVACVGEAGEPGVEVYPAVAHEGYVFLGDTTLLHEVKHLGWIHALHTAFGVSDYHYLVDAELVYGHEEAAYCGVEGVGDCSSGVLNHLDVAVAQAEGSGQELDEAGVHAGDDGELLVGIFRCGKPTVFLIGDELPVVL